MAVGQSIETVGEVLGVLEVGLREREFGLAMRRLEHDVISNGELVGHAHVRRLENDAIDNDEITCAPMAIVPLVSNRKYGPRGASSSGNDAP